MKIEFREILDKDLSTLNQVYIKRFFEKVDLFKNVSSIENISGIKKLKGFKNIYRLRIGDYRLGFSFIGDKIILERFLHRKDIYKFFPK